MSVVVATVLGNVRVFPEVILTSLQSLRRHHSCRTLPDNLRGTTCHLRRQTPETEGGSSGPGARGCARCRSVRPDTLLGTRETE